MASLIEKPLAEVIGRSDESMGTTQTKRRKGEKEKMRFGFEAIRESEFVVS